VLACCDARWCCCRMLVCMLVCCSACSLHADYGEEHSVHASEQ
jgi:hypothetical protein